MFVYRIAVEKYARDLSGEGARLYGGRWNSPGASCLYTSDHSALSMLEVAVHHSAGTIPQNLRLIQIEIPQEGKESCLVIENLKSDFFDVFQTEYTRFIGDSWLKSKSELMMKVPSVIIPHAYNLLFNPHHELFSSIRIAEVTSVTMDGRIKK